MYGTKEHSTLYNAALSDMLFSGPSCKVGQVSGLGASQSASSREARLEQHVGAIQTSQFHKRERLYRGHQILGDATNIRGEFCIEKTMPSPAAEAAWKGRMEAMHAETSALKAIGWKRLGSSASISTTSMEYQHVPSRSYSIRHVATQQGLKSGRVAPGACPLPPTQPDHTLGLVEEAVQGRLYWRYLEFVSAKLLHDRAF